MTLVLFAATTACTGDSGPPTSDVVGTIPWRASESLAYQLKNSRGQMVGQGTLSVAIEAGGTRLSQRFTSEASADEVSVVVDSATLKPISTSRHIATPSDDETIEVTYTDQGALIKQGDRQSGLSVPEHSYDNDASLFLWRTLPFQTGYEASYNTIITNRRTRHKVTLRVTNREEVTVPAGRFTAWRLEIRTSNARQVAWYADLPTRPLVRYDNDRGLIFELETPPP